MKRTLLISTAIFSGLLGTSGWAADYQVQRSLQVPVSSTEAGHMIGDFCDLDDWHSDISVCAPKVVDGGLHRVLRQVSVKKVNALVIFLNARRFRELRTDPSTDAIPT